MMVSVCMCFWWDVGIELLPVVTFTKIKPASWASSLALSINACLAINENYLAYIANLIIDIVSCNHVVFLASDPNCLVVLQDVLMHKLYAQCKISPYRIAELSSKGIFNICNKHRSSISTSLGDLIM